MKGKSKHIVVRNLITICSGLFLLIGLIGTIVSLTINGNKPESSVSFDRNIESYATNQASIKTATLPGVETVSMTEAISNSMVTDYQASGKYITISTPKELYEFSYYCNESSTKAFYLKQYYKLLCNIDYEEEYLENGILKVADPFIPIAWDSTGSAFTGRFDGQGYTISNLQFVKFADVAGSATSVATTYANMQYLAMFCNNAGQISNLGLIQSKLTITVNVNKLSATGGVANLVGNNSGEVFNCFYKDLRETIMEIGISAFGGYQVSGLIFNNTGSVANSYIAVSNVLNYTVKDYDLIAEVIAKNTGIVSNVYFYDSSIFRCTSTEIVYRDNLFDTNNYTTGKQLIGTYVASTDDLRTAFLNLSGWYSFENYSSNVKDYLRTSLNTPIHRGITITGTTATISSTADFLYMYELFNIDDHFATDLTYQITSDINLQNIPSSKYYYKRGISATITGLDTKTSGGAVITLEDNNKSYYPTIYNFNPIDPNRLVVTTGVDTYGLFPYISGTISNLNIVPTTTSTNIDITNVNTTSPNTISIGALTGYNEKGTITNVNVYANFTYAQNVDLGEYYLGGICGLLGGEGTVSSSTVGGSINIGNYSTSVDITKTKYTGGIGIGGAIGYVEETYGNLDTILNKATITVKPNNTNTKYQVGGICGAGYVMTCNSLENQGTITIGVSESTQYSQLYVSGVIGRLLGVSKQINGLTNQGTVTAYLKSSSTINFVSGILNADIVTKPSSSVVASNTDGNLVVSKHKADNGKYLFWASGLTNQANVIVDTASTMYYTDVINVYTSNGFDTTLTGIYNLNYTNILNNKSNITSQTLKMENISEYAPVVNVINGTNTTNITNLDTVYNLKNLVFATTAAINDSNLDMMYGGVVKGKNINYENVRNEGIMTFSINNAITAKSLKVFGVLEEVSGNCTAKTIYNGGNITITSGTNVESTITNTYVAGICYANRSGFNDTTYNKYNPLSKDFDYSLAGTLSDVINNGAVSVVQEGAKTNSKNNINGNIRVSGITIMNEAIISSAFNLGNITLNSYALANKLLECSGIVNTGIGKYAQIKDCANNGTIRNINMSTNAAFVKSAGIMCRNDKKENDSDYSTTASNSNPNSQGSIVFSINYGPVIAFNKKAVNISKTTYSMPCSVASGIVASGLCNTINTVNYANIYGSEDISGMFGVIDFNKFAAEVKIAQKVYIANSINYGNIYVISHRASIEGVPTDVTYSNVTQVELESNKALYIEQSIILTVTPDAYYGSCVSLINYGNNTNAQYLNIRYLINLNERASMVANEIGAPTSITGATTTMFSAKQNDRYLNSGVIYAPLNNTTSSEVTGLFSDNFLFRKAIEGRVTLNTDTNPTDAFLSDYFQFVAYSKVNENLLNSIGWTTIAYNDAAKRFAEDLEALTKLMAEYDTKASSSYNSMLNNAFNTSTWVSNASPAILEAILPDVLASQNINQLRAIISYLFFESENKTEISQTLRNKVVDMMVTYVDSNKTDAELKTILDGLMYPELLAQIIAESDADYKTIKDKFKDNIDALTTSQKLELLHTYINLIDNTNYYKELFDQDIKSYYTTQKFIVLTELLNTLDSDTLGEIFTSLDNTSFSTSMALKYALDQMENTDKRTLFYSIFYNSYSNTSYNNAFTNLYSQLDMDTNSEDYFNATTASSFKDNYFGGEDNYVTVWNAIKNDTSVQEYLLSRFGYVQDSLNNIHKGIYAKATEYRNTYQSNDRPNGATYTVNNDGSVETTFADTNTRILINASENNLYYSRRQNIRNRFIYTPDEYVSDPYTYSTNGDGVETYFYGPYVNAPIVYSTDTGNSATTPKTATMWNHNGQGAPLIGFKINSNTNASGETAAVRRYVPLFISLDESYIANLTGGSLYNTYYKFLWNNCGTGTAVLQWVSIDITTKVPDNNKFVLKKDSTNYTYYTYNNGTATSHIISAANTLYYNYSTVGYTTHNSDIANNLSYNNVANNASGWSANDVLWSYPTANIITGIYMNQDMWGQNGSFITAKNEYGVITTQYIDYSLSDLIALDGVRTKGLSTGAESADEKTIIKDLFDRYLLDNETGQKVVLKAVANALKTNIFSGYANVIFAYAMYTANNTKFINDFLNNVPTTSSSYNLLHSDSETLQTYLYNLFTTNILPSLSQIDKIIYYSSDSRTNMKKILQYFYDKDIGYYTYLDDLSSLYNVLSTYDNADYEIIYDYINANQSASESALSSTISSAVDTYINNYITDYNNANNLTTINNSNASLTGYSVANVSINLADETFGNYKYSSKFVSLDSTNDYTISFTPTSNTATAIVAKGTGTISDGTKTYTVTNALAEYVFDTTSGSAITFTVGSGVEVYAINTHNATATSAQEQYSNITSDGWTLTADNKTIGGISFSSYMRTTGSNKSFSIRLLEDVTSLTVYGQGSSNSNLSYLYYTDTRYISFNNSRSAQSINTTNLNLTAGTILTFNTFTNGNQTTSIYGIKVNDNIYRIVRDTNSTFHVTKNGGLIYRAKPTAGSIISYSSNDFLLTGSVTDLEGNLKYATNDTTLIAIGSNTYYTYDTVSNVVTSTYFANNFIKNNYAKLIAGYSTYDNNAIENYIFNRQYADYTYNLDTGTATDSYSGSVTFGKYAFNATGANSIVVGNASTSYGAATFTKKTTLSANSSQSSGSISFNLTGAGKLFVVAKAATTTYGNLYVTNGSTTYGSYVNGSVNAYEFDLTAGTWYVYANCSLEIYAITAVLNSDLSALNVNYQNVATKGSAIISALQTAGYTSGNYANYKSYYTYLKKKAGFAENSNTTTYYDNEVLLLALTQTTDINLYNLLNNTKIVELLKNVGYKSDQVFGSATSSTSSGLLSYIDLATAKAIITELAKNDKLLADAIIKATLNSTTVADASKLERELVAAYVSTEFLPKFEGNSFSDSYLNTVIETIDSGYDFITDDNKVSTTEFLALMSHLGVDVATDGYGIFALASSHGIQNGTFIPDNIDLRTLDAKYKKLDGNERIELTDSNSSSWRDLTGTSTSDNYVVTKTTSVNYHVREEMKQLKKSISTTIFELDLKYNNSYNIYASESQIDYSEKTITYTVSTAYYNTLKSKTSLTIANIRIAESATYTSHLNSISWDNDTANTTLTFADAITVKAEDTTVSSKYTIIIKGVAINYTMEYDSTTYINSQGNKVTTDSDMDIPYYGATIRFRIESSSFAEGLDLKNYFFVGSSTAISSAYANPTYWKFASGVSNNGIVDANGDAYISVDVLQAMPKGDKQFVLRFGGTTSALLKAVKIAKEANNAALITSFGFDGNDLTSSITGSSKSVKSDILFGRAFTYQELTEYESSSFYLYDFAISDNATVSITATKSISNGLMSYVVTYVVTAENGTTTNIYKHTLTELSPYTNNEIYADLYREGSAHEPYIKAFEGQPAKGTSTLTYSSAQSNYAAVYFNRGEDYQYRIKYRLNNFYITDREANFNASDATLANGSSITESYAGLTVSVTASQNPGTYVFNYVYTNTATWDSPATYSSAASLTYDSSATYYVLIDGEYVTAESRGVIVTEEIFEMYKSQLYVKNLDDSGLYTRTYTFPTLYVIKDYAINALISRLTFLDESIVLGDTATVMAAGHPLIPTKDDGSTYSASYDQVGSVSANSGVEWKYNDAFNHNTGITIKTTEIKYNSASSDSSVTDYYALGTVSDSDLTYYSPTFAVDKYAQIYKYTTLNRLISYGEDTPDKGVLSKHTNRYIYVPFDFTIGSTVTTVVFMVEIEDGTNKWLKVYDTGYDGQDESHLIHTYTTNVSTYTAKTDESGFIYEGKEYTLNALAGTTNSENISLYMDYIGNPAEGHFWYISYAVFSEYYLQNGITDVNGDGEDDLGAVKYYHISIIDATNTIYFEVDIYAATDFEINEVYLTIAENIYDVTNTYTGSRQISGYAIQDYEYKEIELTSSTYVSGKYYIQNRDGTYTLSTGGYSSTTTYYDRGELSISNDYDRINILDMTQAKFDAGEFYTYHEYTIATVTSASFETNKYYTYSDYKPVSISSSAFVENMYYYVDTNGDYQLATTYTQGTQYYRQIPTYTLATEYSSSDTYYEKTDTYTKETTYVPGTQYYKKSATFGLVKYTLRYSLAVLPKGYFYFYLDLPTGYVAKCVTDMENQLSKQTSTIYGTTTVLKDEEEGSFVPYTSIITQTVNLDIIISRGSGADASAWAVSTSDLYNRQVTYVGNSWDEE